MLRKLRGLVVALGVTISLSAAAAPTDAAAYTCGYGGGSCGHRCYDGDYAGNHYGRRFDDCGWSSDYRGYGYDYDGYGGGDGDRGYSSDYCRSCVFPSCRRYSRCD
jgi:hypothetical protein